MSEEIISLHPDNIDGEMICCAMSDKKCANGVYLKKSWLKARFTEGLQFKRLNVRGKVFIEYLPADAAWSPIVAPGYMFINCFWVSGSYKGKGHGNHLLEACIQDTNAADLNGIVVMTSKPKKPYMSERSFFMAKGFEVCDTAPPYFELLVKRLKEEAPLPAFADSVRMATTEADDYGWLITYTDQCPFTDYYTGELERYAKQHEIPLRLHKITSKAEAQSAPCPFTTYSVFYRGQFVTHEILTVAKFERLIQSFRK